MRRTTPFVALSLALALGAGVPASAAAQAQDSTGKASGPLTTLTPLDYIEIRQLAARYGHAVDQGAAEGYAYADLFAEGATFGQTTGRDNLAKLAKGTARGPQTAWHFIVNHVIEPTADGAKGKEYLVHLQYGDGVKPNAVWGGGHYEDTYVKTPDGWRFKTRRFVPSDGTPESLLPRPAATR
jgi:hypothetical protein